MSAGRVVVRPVNDRRTTGIVNHFAADFDPIAGLRGTPRSDVDVVDYFTGPAALRTSKASCMQCVREP